MWKMQTVTTRRIFRFDGRTWRRASGYHAQKTGGEGMRCRSDVYRKNGKWSRAARLLYVPRRQQSEGKLSTLQESRATGYLNDLPEINYDFNAPIRQYGTISDSYREIKLLALFLNDFGEDMASLRSEIPTIRILPGDMHTVRTACRHDADHGYVFLTITREDGRWMIIHR